MESKRKVNFEMDNDCIKQNKKKNSDFRNKDGIGAVRVEM